MKKWIVLVLGVLILAVTLIYILIPGKMVFSGLSRGIATPEGANRSISQEDKWAKWWPDTDTAKHIAGTPFKYRGSSFQFLGTGTSAVGLAINHKGEKYLSVLHVLNLNRDTIGVVWQFETASTNNPLHRLTNYFHAAQLNRDLNIIVNRFTKFVSNPENIYGFHFFKAFYKDTTLLSMRFTSPAYPSTEEIYARFDTLRKNIAKQKGKEISNPMMNVTLLPDGQYETQVAIPTDKELSNDGKIVYRRMVPGTFICVEFNGGAYTTQEALKQMNNFISDCHKSVMANPFQILLTDRMHEPDTLKWKTRTYIPVANNDPLN